MAHGYIGGWTRRLFQMLFDLVDNKYAIPTTDRVEANIKNGYQFFINEIFVDLGPSESKFLLVRFTEDVVVSSRSMTTNSPNIYYRAYSNPVLSSDGTPIEIKNYNLVDGATTESSSFEDPVISSNGNMIIEDWIPGSEGIGGRHLGAFGLDGVIRVVPAGDYLLEIENTGTGNGTIQYVLTWSEGPIYDLGEHPLF